MNDYELVVLLHPDLEIDLEKPLKKVESIISKNQGNIKSKDNWGKRKLAYPIKKEEYAIYLYYEIQLPAETVSKVSAAFNITDEVLRYLIAHPVPKADREETEATKPSSDTISKGKSKEL